MMHSTQGKPSRESRWLYRLGRIGTNCPRYVGALRDLQATACSDMSVLLLGPTGTGKELLARAIHRASGRAGEFIAINCASLPEHLVCSELFGFERGAFSGAERAQPGALRASNGGTLFLDEVADAPLPVQVALLRALELQRVRPVGGVRELPVRLRVIAATSRDIHVGMQEGSFRPDLFFRLAGFEFTVPALHERPVDFEPLCVELLRELGHCGQIDAAAIAHLKSQAWPGNLRQLRTHLQRALLRAGPVTPLERKHLGAASGTFSLGTAIAPRAASSPDPEPSSAPSAADHDAERNWLQGCLTEEQMLAAARFRATAKLPEPPDASRRRIRTWERALLVCLLTLEPRHDLPAQLSRRVGRLFHSGWHLAEEGRPVVKLAETLGAVGSEERLRRLVEVLVGRG